MPIEPTFDSPRSYCLKAKQELGLETYSIEETLKANVDSLIELGLCEPKRKQLDQNQSAPPFSPPPPSPHFSRSAEGERSADVRSVVVALAVMAKYIAPRL